MLISVVRRITAILAFLIFILQLKSFCQSAEDSLNYPRVGRPCPDLVLHDIHYFSRKEAKISDFKGKWLILIFWNKNCPGCIASFPAENNLQKELANKAQVMHIGEIDPEGQVKVVYARYREKMKLELPCAFETVNDTSWTFANGTILIDDKGIVRAKNGYIGIAEIKSFLSGHPPKLPFDGTGFYKFEKSPLIPFNDHKPFLVNGNGGPDSNFTYRSMISEFDCTNQHSSISDIDKGLDEGQFQVLGLPLYMLYNFAYYGTRFPVDLEKYSTHYVLQLKDSSFFNFSGCKNLFCYSLILPKVRANKRRVMHFMQRDLENYFGFTASIDERKFPAWKLVASEKAKRSLKTKGGMFEEGRTSKEEDFFARNCPMADLCHMLLGPFGDVLDSTGITSNIDIKLHCNFFITAEVIKALHDIGLELVPIEVTKKVLVIRDDGEFE